MNIHIRITVVAAALLAAALFATGAAAAEEKYSGYLCCNMRTDGSWISDINYAGGGMRLLPLGTPVTITGYGRHRVRVEINGERQALGNDYSRDLSRAEFARRYVLREDPRAQLHAAPEKIQQAIRQSRATPGMSREQVIMALGYPVTSENPDLDFDLWRYWRDSFAEYQIHFDQGGQVVDITAEPTLRNLVWLP